LSTLATSHPYSRFCFLTSTATPDIYTLSLHDALPISTLTAPAPRSAFARTLETTELVGLFRADILELAARKPAISSSILLGLTRVVSERLQAASLEIRRLKNQPSEHILPENIEI